MSDGAEIPGVRIRIRDPGDRERAVKSARDFGRSLGFEGTGAEEIALVVSELASNAEKYAGTEGTIALDGVRDAAGSASGST
ncbi:MAG: hypothetical protein MUC63_10605 [Planctomycetes bacterium]|nr:hypothetical protein [Planctomycetota bacterium]